MKIIFYSFTACSPRHSLPAIHPSFLFSHWIVSLLPPPPKSLECKHTPLCLATSLFLKLTFSKRLFLVTVSKIYTNITPVLPVSLLFIAFFSSALIVDLKYLLLDLSDCHGQWDEEAVTCICGLWAAINVNLYNIDDNDDNATDRALTEPITDQ